MKKLPVAIETFSEIRSNNYIYVDKTQYALGLINSGKYFFLSRPRRFGKSLFLNTLRCIFEGREALCENLKIHDQYDWTKRFPVIDINLTMGVSSTRERLYSRIISILDSNRKRLGVMCQKTDDPVIFFRELIENIYEKFKTPVVVLVDEYDKPILDNLTKPEVVKEMRDGLRDFYSVIKGSDSYLKFVFLTGVSKFSHVSIFSNLNNLKDISLTKEYGAICGYTQEELENSFGEHLDGIDPDELRQWYNGYSFLGETVYNPYDILLFLDNREKEFLNYWFQTGTPSFLIQLLKEKRYFIPNLANIQASSEILESFDLDDISVETILFQTGYLTIKEVSRVGPRIKFRLTYPNLEVQLSLNDHIINYLTQDRTGKIKHQDNIYFALESGNPDGLHQSLTALFASIPYNNFVNSKIHEYEGYYASVVYSFFASIGIQLVAEDVTSKGRIDLTMILNGQVFIFEFKVIKDYGGKDHNNEIQNREDLNGGGGDKQNIQKNRNLNLALQQIKDKKYHEKYLNKKSVFIIGVIFSCKERNIVDYQWEKI